MELILIEDCAHAIESKFNNQHCGTFGDIGCFSLDNNKLLAAGEGGVLVTNNKNFFERALLASEILHKKNISCSIINMHTIKPFDSDLFLDCLSKVKAVITVEEHSENGGLGEKCASIISQSNIKIPFKILGFPDEYMTNGSQADVLDHYNMSPEKLAEIAEENLK